MLNKGFIHGHDNAFHYAQIQDLYDSLKANNFNLYLNYEAIHSYGMGVRLMYASLSHFLVVIVGFVIIPFGLSLTSAMKLVIFFSIFFSGIFTYKFLKSLTKRDLPSILGAAIYMLFPYRFTDIYIRNALAETVAMTFIPLVFWGINDILKQREYRIKPYIITVLGISLLFLCHNITTIYTIIFVIIYVLFNFKDFVSLVRKRSFWASTTVSVVFILCFTSILFVPMLQHMNLGIYRIFDPESMRTTIDLIIDGTKNSETFLSLGVYSEYANLILYYSILTITSYAIYYFISKYIKDKKIDNLIKSSAFLIAFIIGLIFSIINYRNYILYIAVILTFGLYFIPYKKEKRTKQIGALVSFIFMTVITILLIFWGDIWKILPEALYKIQFPWRLWAFVAFFLGAIVAIIASNINYAKIPIAKFGFAFTTCAMLCFIKPIDKNQYNYGGNECYSEIWSIGIENTYSKYAAGWQLEYFTTEYYSGPKSDFWWKVYSEYFNADPENGKIPDYIGVISGDAKESNYLYDDGVITFDLECNTESLIEVARVYYLGYKVTITDDNGNVTKLKPFARESFLAFNVVNSGHVRIEYVGTTGMHFAKVAFGIAFFSMIGLGTILSASLRKRDYIRRFKITLK